MTSRKFLRRSDLGVALAAALSFLASSPASATVMVQYFESKWETIERRMPDVFMAGYGAMWLPPAARADSGNFSVGFDVFNRFDLGTESNPTLYGTENSIKALIDQARRAGIYTYFDTVYNHNGFSDGYRGDQAGQNPCQLNWAISEGGYPGFVLSGRDLGLDFNLEFRNVCPSAEFPSPSCDTDPTNCRISNLIDINHDTNYQWIRHPAQEGNAGNIPYQPVNPANTRLYPDKNLASPYDDGVFPFNLANPSAGDPGLENVNQMLQRYSQWMLEANGVLGFRLDAVKHTPAGWFTNIFDFAVHNRGRDFWGRQITPFSFGEFVSSNFGELSAYHRKDGYGNRTVLDFPLKFSLGNLGNPSGDFSAILGASFDSSDGDGQDGSAGVMFIQSHDTGGIGDPPDVQNVAYAYILSRKGFPIVYYNAQEFGTEREFPNRNNRGDAFGRFGTIITKLVDVNNDLVNGRGGNFYRSLWQDADVVAYEMNNTVVVGLCDRKDRGSSNLGYEERSVGNFGYRNVTLVEVSGNASDPTVDPQNDIPDSIFIPESGNFTLRIPTTTNRNNAEHGRPYVMYALATPQGTLSLDNVASTIPADDGAKWHGVARVTPIDVVTGNTAQVRLQITQGGAVEDNALIKWNYGLNVDGNNDGAFGCALGVDGLLAGYENFTTQHSPSTGGTGTYRLNVDLTNSAIPEGYNYISAVAFVPRLEGLPPVFNTFRKVIYVDRVAPGMTVLFPPTQTGVDDIASSTYGFVVENPDKTANELHYFWNLPAGTNPVTSGLLNDSNKATKSDRARYRFTLDDLTDGDNQRLTLVLLEESGNYRVQEFAIGVDLGEPQKPNGFLLF